MDRSDFDARMKPAKQTQFKMEAAPFRPKTALAPLTPDSPFPFGKHGPKGSRLKMREVPVEYYEWLNKEMEPGRNRWQPLIRQYIAEHMERIELEPDDPITMGGLCHKPDPSAPDTVRSAERDARDYAKPDPMFGKGR
jgi:hypothetical protein